MRVKSTVNTVINGRSFSAGIPVPLSEAEVNAMGADITSGLLIVIPDNDPASVVSSDPLAVPVPDAPTPPPLPTSLATGGFVQAPSTGPAAGTTVSTDGK